MRAKHRVYLIPGFFGFTHLGDEGTERLFYFDHAREQLLAGFQQRGLTEVKVEALACSPTASLQTRARDVLREMAKTASEDDAQLHLIGHSTGGLDARGIVSLRMAAEAPPFVKRVRSVVTMATPHFGTPLASYFHEGQRGELLLKYLWLFTTLVLRRELKPVTALALALLYRASTLGDWPGRRKDLLDELILMLRKLSDAEHAELEQYFGQIGKDRRLIDQLRPTMVERFNQETQDHASVRYGCVVTGAPQPDFKGLLRAVTGAEAPGLSSLLSRRLLDQRPALLYSLFRFLYAKTEPHSSELRTPEPSQDQRAMLEQGLGRDFRDRSDGIVPTRSQVWGQIIDAVEADHLDVTGHFDEPPEYVSWLKSGSHFDSKRYGLLWQRVIDFMVG
jgi:pimeloyl-ACP methyl ester carboxylesterase